MPRCKTTKMPNPTLANYNNPDKLDELRLFWSNDYNKSIIYTEYTASSTFGNIPTTNGNDIDDLYMTISKTYAGIFLTTSASHKILIADNKSTSIDNLFTIFRQAYTGIFLTTSAFRTKTYKQKTGWKAETCISQYKNIKNPHDKDKADVQSCYLLYNSANYALALYLHEIGCTKGDVDFFFKTKLLECFYIGFQIQKLFCSGFSFKNSEEWLCQLDQILTDICDNNW